MTPFGLSPLRPNFDAALRDVKASNAKYREAAVGVLAMPPEGREQEAREGLLDLLSDKYGPIRAQAAEGLAMVGDADDVDILRAATGDEHAYARGAAITAAAALDEGRCDWLDTLLDDDDASVTATVLEAIASRRPKDAIRFARAFLSDDDPLIQASAANLLGDLGAKSEDQLGPEKAAVLTGLKEGLEAPVNVSRAFAIALARLKMPDGERVLVDALRDPPWRIAAIEALGLLDSKSSADALAELGERFLASPLEKAAAASALADRDDKRAIPILRAVLSAWRADGRTYALEVVAQHGFEELTDEVIGLAGRPRGAALSAVAHALATLPSPRAASTLTQLKLQHPDLS